MPRRRKQSAENSGKHVAGAAGRHAAVAGLIDPQVPVRCGGYGRGIFEYAGDAESAGDRKRTARQIGKQIPDRYSEQA